MKREQQVFFGDFETRHFDNLGATLDSNGIITVGQRIQQVVTLLPECKVVELIIKEEHEKGHSGVLTTASKVRTRVWVRKLNKVVRKVIKKCMKCRM